MKQGLVVCGSDQSPYALEALEVAAALSRKQGKDLCALTVLDEVGVETSALARARAALASDVARYSDTTDVHAIDGAPVEALVRTVEQREADLLVVGARGLGRRDLAARLGSVSGALVAKSPVPVLVVRRREPLLDAIAGRAALRVLIAADEDGAPDALAWCEAAREHMLVESTLVHCDDESSLAATIAEHAARTHAGLVVVVRRSQRRLLRRARSRAIVAECTTNALCVPERAG